MKKSALLVIDVQHGLLDREPRPLEADLVVGRINRLAAAAREAGCPVVFIQHERAGSPLEHGSDFWQLAHGLVVEPTDHLLRKTTPDSANEKFNRMSANMARLAHARTSSAPGL